MRNRKRGGLILTGIDVCEDTIRAPVGHDQADAAIVVLALRVLGDLLTDGHLHAVVSKHEVDELSWEIATHPVVLLDARVCRKCCHDVAQVVDSVVDVLGELPADISPRLTLVGVVAAVLALENVGAEVGHMRKTVRGVVQPGDASVREGGVVGQGSGEVVFMRQSDAECVEEGHRHEGDENGDGSHLDGEMG